MDKLTWNELDNAELQYRILLTGAFSGNPRKMDALRALYKISPQPDERIRYFGALMEASQKYDITDNKSAAIFKKWDVDHLFRQIISGQIIT